MAEDTGSGWVSFTADKDGRPSAEGNDHLTDEQRAAVTRDAEERAARRGPRQLIVITTVYANDEADAYVQIPEESSLGPFDSDEINRRVALAAQTLQEWR